MPRKSIINTNKSLVKIPDDQYTPITRRTSRISRPNTEIIHTNPKRIVN